MDKKNLLKTRKETNVSNGLGQQLVLQKAIERDYTSIPLKLFADRSLAVLESLVVYLHDSKGYTFREISFMINRNERTIYTAYKRSCDKKQVISGQKQDNLKL